jgi:hypothetical protein
VSSPSHIYMYNKSNPVIRKCQQNRTHFILSQLIHAICSNVQQFVAEGFCLYLLPIMKPHWSELFMKCSVNRWADLFPFSPNGRLLLTYGMWRRLLDSSQEDWFFDGLPFLSFSSPSCNSRSRSVRFHFSPWKRTGFKRWWHNVKGV